MPNTLMNTPDVLKKIAAYKVDEVTALKASTTIKALRDQAAALPAPRGFARAIQTAAKTRPALICASCPNLFAYNKKMRIRQESSSRWVKRVHLGLRLKAFFFGVGQL